MEISKEQAYEILSGVMRFLYLTEIKPLEPERVEQSPPTSPMQASMIQSLMRKGASALSRKGKAKR